MNRKRNRESAVAAVLQCLNSIDYANYSAKVAASVAKKAEIQDRIRARSLVGCCRGRVQIKL